MSFLRTKLFRVLLGLVILFSSWLVLYESYRATARALLLVLIGCCVHYIITANTKWMRLAFVAFLIIAFLPVDVSLRNFPGPPRFVPLIMGAPSDEDVAREKRGEVMLGGCILRANEPKWIWVW